MSFADIGNKAAETDISLNDNEKDTNKHSKKTVQIKAERNLLGRLLMISQQHDISLEKLFRYPLGPIPWSLATADGSLVKTDKSKLLHHLEGLLSVPDTPPIDTTTYVIDGNAQFQAYGHLPDTFEELACFPAYQIDNNPFCYRYIQTKQYQRYGKRQTRIILNIS